MAGSTKTHSARHHEGHGRSAGAGKPPEAGLQRPAPFGKISHGYYRGAVCGRQAVYFTDHGLLQRRDRRARDAGQYEEGAVHRHGAAAGADLSEPERSGVPLRSRESIHQRSFLRRAVSLRHDTEPQRHRTLLRQRTYGELFRHAQEREDLSDRGAYKLPREQVKTIIFRYIFIYYNRVRIYTRNPLGLPPVKYREWVQAQQAV